MKLGMPKFSGSICCIIESVCISFKGAICMYHLHVPFHLYLILAEIARAVSSIKNPLCRSPPPVVYNADTKRVLRNIQSAPPLRRIKSANVAYNFNRPVHLPTSLKNNEFLTHPGLSEGQKQYIWGVANVYSLQDFKEAQQRRRHDILDREFSKRTLTKGISSSARLQLWKEYSEYQKTIDSLSVNYFSNF